MITFYSDRIEIISFGTLPPKQTLEGFYRGHSIPANKELSDIFMQLHLSEKTGRGVPRIVSHYTMKAFDITSDSITVTIPFDLIDSTDVTNQKVGIKVGNKVGDKAAFKVNRTREKILEEIRNNANVTTAQLSLLIGITEKGIAKNISILKKAGILTRQGSRKTGIWVIEP